MHLVVWRMRSAAISWLGKLLRFVLALGLVGALALAALGVAAEVYVIDRDSSFDFAVALPAQLNPAKKVKKIQLTGGAIKIPITILGTRNFGNWVRDVHVDGAELTLANEAADFDFVKTVQLMALTSDG